MDPVTGAILLAIIVQLCARTVGKGVSDAFATKRGETPPSLEKWRQRQQQRVARGEKAEKEPSPWRRRWRMAADEYVAKAAQKHQAKMEDLRDNGRANVNRHKARLRRRRDMADAVEGWAAGRWEGLKTWNEERNAWKLNEGRSPDPVDPSTTSAAPGEKQEGGAGPAGSAGRDAEVLPFPSRGVAGKPGPDRGETSRPEEELADYTALNPEQLKVVGDWMQALAVGEGGHFVPASDFFALPDAVRADLIAANWERGATVGNENGTPLEEWDPAAKRILDARGITAPEDALATTAGDRRGSKITAAPPSPGETPDATAQKPGGEPVHNPTETEGNPAMTTAMHSGEITDLPSATAYCQAGVSYCDTISGKFENTQAQAATTINDLRAQLSTLENAQANFHGQGLTAQAGRLAVVAEHFNSLIAVAQKMEAMLAETTDAIAAARGELSTTAEQFRRQYGIAEQVQSHAQGSVANQTAFYANA